MQLRKLHRASLTTLELLWDDGHLERVGTRALRDACPCAGCKGETILGKHYGPSPVDHEAPGRYDLLAAEPVGGYAIRFSWGDGHSDGIYSWNILRSLCECEQCTGQANGTKGVT